MTQRHEKVLVLEFSNEQVCFGMENRLHCDTSD